MEIKKTMIVEAITTDGKPMEIGKRYVFHTGGRDHIGTYSGIGLRGMLAMKNVIPGHEDVTFNIKPQSVESIYEAEINVHKGENKGEIGKE